MIVKLFLWAMAAFLQRYPFPKNVSKAESRNKLERCWPLLAGIYASPIPPTTFICSDCEVQG